MNKPDNKENPAPALFVCPYHKPPTPWTWRDTMGMLLLIVASIALSIGLLQAMKWSEPYWIMSGYLTKPLTLYAYRGRTDWVDRDRIEKSIAQKELETYRDGFRDGKGLCEAKYNKRFITTLWVSMGCIDACAAMRKAGSQDMNVQTPGHACEFFCEADNERGNDAWPIACLQKAKSYREVYDCWLASEDGK